MFLCFFHSRLWRLDGLLPGQLDSGTRIPKLSRSQERFKGSVNLCALTRRDFFGLVRELDIRPRVSLADDLGQACGNCFYRQAVIPVVGD